MNLQLILNATAVESGLGLDRYDAEDRARLVKMIDALIDSLELVYEDGLPRSESLIWLDTDLGEGSIFRALSAGIPTMLTFEFAVRDYLEAAVEDMNAITTKYKPDVLLLPVLNAAQDMGNISEPGSAGQIAGSMTPIDKHIGIYDFANSFGVEVGWDVRKPRGEWLDPVLLSENALRVVSLFQDVSLDPRLWVMELPTIRIVAETLSARAHIDDRTDVMACFTLDAIFPLAFSEQTTLSALPHAIESSAASVSEMPGNAKVVVGAETFAPCLREIGRGDATVEEITESIADRMSAVLEIMHRERVSV